MQVRLLPRMAPTVGGAIWQLSRSIGHASSRMPLLRVEAVRAGIVLLFLEFLILPLVADSLEFLISLFVLQQPAAALVVFLIFKQPGGAFVILSGGFIAQCFVEFLLVLAIAGPVKLLIFLASRAVITQRLVEFFLVLSRPAISELVLLVFSELKPARRCPFSPLGPTAVASPLPIHG